jgi:mannonate dehydratase
MLEEQARRRVNGDEDRSVPFRPDHGYELLDLGPRKAHPGYKLIGRICGLAELRRVMTAVASLRVQAGLIMVMVGPPA